MSKLISMSTQFGISAKLKNSAILTRLAFARTVAPECSRVDKFKKLNFYAIDWPL